MEAELELKLAMGAGVTSRRGGKRGREATEVMTEEQVMQEEEEEQEEGRFMGPSGKRSRR
jgi:hypothetical protein